MKTTGFDNIRLIHSKAEKALKEAVRKAIRQHESAGVPAIIW